MRISLLPFSQQGKLQLQSHCEDDLQCIYSYHDICHTVGIHKWHNLVHYLKYFNGKIKQILNRKIKVDTIFNVFGEKIYNIGGLNKDL